MTDKPKPTELTKEDKAAHQAKLDKARKKLLRKQQKAALKKRMEILRWELPHLYGFKWYEWAWEFFSNTKDKVQMLTAANQISKSSTAIRKSIHWSTEKELWDELWPGHPHPNLIWYLYPSKDVATAEFKKKWKPQFMPRGAMEHDAKYGWKAHMDGKHISHIDFKSGMTIYFKTYAQNVDTLQSGSVFAIFCFPAGTRISTPFGERDIEDVSVGDIVDTHAGPKKVTKLYRQRGTVQVRELSKNLTIEATGNHPFWTYNRGWVNFENLRPGDVCSISLTKKLFYLMGSFTPTILQVVMKGCVTTLAHLVLVSTYMLLCGRLITKEKSQKVMSSTIRIITLKTIRSKILNLCQGQLTRLTTKGKSGRGKRLTLEFVRNVVKTLPLGPLRRPLNFVLRNVEDLLSYVLAFVAALHMRLARIHVQSSVLGPVRISDKPVYNFETENAHTYYANGFLVHNCDEELPENLYQELTFRIFGTEGFFHMVFTATKGQQLWYRAMEMIGHKQEFLKSAWKRTVSAYECLRYRDGSKSPWTIERIKKAEELCKNQAEIDKRIHGRFVTTDGRVIHTFDPAVHYVEPYPIPKNWERYVAVDIGSGGEKGHPSAICFIAVKPNYKEGVIYKGWRGDKIQTTSGDVYNKYLELKDRDEYLTKKSYDFANADFNTETQRAGEPFQKADKAVGKGEDLFNDLLKHGMLKIFDTEQLQKLGGECMSVVHETPKRSRADDFIDATRYCLMSIPWDMSEIVEEQKAKKKKQSRPKLPSDPDALARKNLEDQRNGTYKGPDYVEGQNIDEAEGWQELENELEEINGYYGSDY